MTYIYMRIKIYATPSQSIPSPMTANTNLPWLGGVGAQGVYRQWRYEKKYRFSYLQATWLCNRPVGTRQYTWVRVGALGQT